MNEKQYSNLSLDIINIIAFLSLQQFGRCYTFNSGKPGHPLLYQSFAGQFSGLEMTLNAEPDEYYGPFSYEGVGFRLLVASPNEAEFKMDQQAITISPGFSYGVAITKKEVRLNCFKRRNKLVPNNSLSLIFVRL